MLQRLVRGGVGKGGRGARSNPVHLKPVGRLDMMTEGLMIFTNDGGYARELELPKNSCWRTYRARVHGRLTTGKMRAMRNGVTVRVDDNGNDNTGKSNGKTKSAGGTVVDVVKTGRLMRYKGIKVSIERRNLSSSRGTRGSSGNGGSGRGTNTWLRITCTEGKNRQLRRILESLGLDVTRLIRISYGDYDLDTIPPGMAIEVKCKRLDEMKRRGPLFVGGGGDKTREKRGGGEDDDGTSTVEWINYS
jgi:23S rRNA pseudouridine2605 synthase